MESFSIDGVTTVACHFSRSEPLASTLAARRQPKTDGTRAELSLILMLQEG